MAKINWRARIGVSIGSGSCKPTGGLGAEDYVQFKHYTEEANKVYMN